MFTMALQGNLRAKRLFYAVFLALLVSSSTIPVFAQVPGPSINMVTGTQWPGGDPFLERQNEPSMAVSSRNPLHLLAGNNDYRTVDLPGLASGKPTGDAWLGLFSSVDGGNLWQSVLVPGYPQDTSTAGLTSPLKGYEAGADPTVRAGSNGLFYYGGLVFNREANGTSAVFVSRFVDDNNLQGSSAARYISTSIVATGDATHFIDKPVIAVDIPRPGSPSCKIPAGPNAPAATISAGRIYVAYTQFSGNESSNVSNIMFSYSSDCGVTWTSPHQVSAFAQTNQGAALAVDPTTGNVYIVWRVFKDQIFSDSLAGEAFEYQNSSFTPIIPGSITPFDQGTTNVSFRTNAYPSIAVDNSGRLYIAWAQRGSSSDPVTGGDARIQVITGKPIYFGGYVLFMLFSQPVVIDPYQGRGHQIMPALAFSSGKLTAAWYDFRDDDHVEVYNATGGGNYTAQDELPQGVTPIFSNFVADPSAPYSHSVWRHTVDVRAAQMPPADSPAFKTSVLVSQYSFGTPPFNPAAAVLPADNENIQQLDFDAPNLPLFQLGTVPFVGDYIDVAGPTFVPTFSGATETWRFNNLPSDPDHTHVVWTDNRNVVQPADGNWANFTPVGSNGGTSLFDPTKSAPACTPGQTGIRNQDIYTAALSSGLVLSSRGNAKLLSKTLTREFPVTLENPTSQTLYYLLTIQSQPAGGSASFLQAPVKGLPSPLTQLTVTVAPVSSVSRSVFLLSSNPTATVSVNAVQTDINNNVVPNGLTSTVALNSDVSNPNISNPNISNVEIYNPNISNPNISNPNISNPNISNPNISNPNISNPNISNPNISNVTVANPNISNPNISNPNISNPNISNPNISNPNISNAALSGEITDVSYTVTNAGNTAVSYALNLVQSQAPPTGVSVQLIVSGVYFTPVANGCTLAEEPHYTPIANIPNPTFIAVGGLLPLGPPSPQTPTFSLQPGEQAVITIRVYDPKATTPAQALLDYNPAVAITPVVASLGVNTKFPPVTIQVPVLSIITSALPAASLNGLFTYNLRASGGLGSYTFSALPGSLPAGLSLSPTGVLSGKVAAVGSFAISFQVSDTSGQSAQRTLTLNATGGSVLSLATSALPAGRFNLPYSVQLTANGGTPPYSFSMANSSPLPAGMSLSSTGLLQGPPGQVGLWNVGLVVTDSAASPATGTASLPLTIGLPTSYAGVSSCSMPIPAVPLYYAGAVKWAYALGSNFPVTNTFALINGSYLAGCVYEYYGSTVSGAYPISFTAQDVNGNTLGTFTFNLMVIGMSDTLDNGLVNISGSSSNETISSPGLLPNYDLQGVVAPSSLLQIYGSSPGTNSFGGDATSFSGNYLFGLNYGGAQVCTSSNSGSVSLNAPTLGNVPAVGRFDLLFNGTTQGCPDGSPVFPSSPANITFASVDAIGTTVSIPGATVSNVSLSSTSQYAYAPAPNVLRIYQQATGSTLPVSLTLTYAMNQSQCGSGGCILQLQYGLNTDPASQGYANSTSPTSGTNTVTVNVPNQPGRYYVCIDRSLQYSYVPAWWDGQPSASHYIAVVDVIFSTN